MGRVATLVMVLSLLAESLAGAAFNDVDPDHPFFDDITWMADLGITGGFPDGGFHPSDPVTRQSMAAFLHRLYGHVRRDPLIVPDPGFTDVSPGHPFHDDIAWMAALDITAGFPDGGYHPGAVVTRQSMAAFLHRLWLDMGYPDAGVDPGFSDVPPSHPFHDDIVWMATLEITGGFADGTFRPNRAVSRQSMAAFLHRLYDQLGIIVDTEADTPDLLPGDGLCLDVAGDCSLRAAITEANADAAADIVIIAPGLDPVLTRQGTEDFNTDGDLDIREPVELEGNGATITAPPFDRIFQIYDVTQLHTVTLTGGYAPNGGGAIRTHADLLLENSTLTGNEDTCCGGGGIYVFSGTTTVRASTIAGNVGIAPDGIQVVGGATARLQGSVLAHGHDEQCAGTVISDGYNVASDASCNLNQASDHPATDPLIEGFPEDSGALVYQPYANSPLVDAIPPGTAGLCDAAATTDERGAARPQGAGCDIGAYEGHNPSSAAGPLDLTVNSAVDQVDAVPGDGVCATAGGVCTLRAAVDETNTWPYHDEVSIDDGINPTLSIAGKSENHNQTGDLDLYGGLTIHGNGAILNAALLDRALDQHPIAGGLALDHLVIQHGRLTGTTEPGGGIRSRAPLTLDAVTLHDNRTVGNGAGADGGGVYQEYVAGDLIITNSTFTSNGAGLGQGGAIHNAGGLPASITNSTFVDNNGWTGGTVQGVAIITNSTISSSLDNILSGNIQIKATIIADASDACAPGSVSSLGWNLVQDSSCPTDGPSDVLANPMLGALADNGGPTQTFLPAGGSSAINSIPAGTAGLCDGTIPTDQRGVARPQSTHCDRGSVEQ